MRNDKLKVAYICAFAHVTVIDKGTIIEGRFPEQIQCTHLHCLNPAHLFSETVIDESVTATHEFFDKNNVDRVLSIEEDNYLQAGGLMFREIPEKVSNQVKNEFKNTEEQIRLAQFLLENVSESERIGRPVDTAIDQITKFNELKQANINYIRNNRLRQN